MNTPQQPAPAEVAGVPIMDEGPEDITRKPRAVDPSHKSAAAAIVRQPPEVAGIPCCAEGTEDTTRRPRRKPA